MFLFSIIGYLSFNASSNLAARGIDTGFSFLNKKASFDIQFSLIEFDSSMTYGRAYLVGLLNTILVSVIGILFATIVGFFFGILRLSSNPLASGLATCYIETLRNISLLLQIFFWYFAVLRLLPSAENSLVLFNFVYANIKGIYIPRFVWTNLSYLIYGLVFTFFSIYIFNRYANNLREKTGKQLPKFSISVGLLFLIPILVIIIFGIDLILTNPSVNALKYKPVPPTKIGICFFYSINTPHIIK